MATYFHGGNSGSSDIHHHQSSAEGGGLQTLFLMNPNNYVPFSSDTAQNPTPNMLFLNPNNSTTTPHALNLASLTHAPPQQQIIGVASNNILGPAGGGNEISGFHGFVGPTPRVHHYNWGSIMDQTALSSSSSSVVAATVTVLPNNRDYSEHTVTTATTEMGFHRARGHQSHHHPQGLSLSLSSQQLPFRSFANAGGALNSSIQSVVLGSKFLKVAQELLDEAVNVGNDNKVDYSNNKEKMKGNKNVESTSDGGGDDNRSSGGGDGENSGGDNKQGSELNTAQRQELHMNKSKLVTMLDEVEQRYREYKQQMQIVTSSFEEAAGYGAARTYTALALKTISKQFRCLKDAISLQIKTTGKTLGEDNCMGVKVEGSRLRFIDHNLRQQRALQQLGMIQHNAWRPQRGLPERAVSILRAWLFEHFLHPYPKDSDKVMLARQTGLTRSQVSNWFINARVRLWKPMVEEMYLEEIKDQEHNNNNGSQDDDDDDTNTANKKKKQLIRESSNKELWSSSSSQLEQPPCSSSVIRLDHLNSNQNTTTPITEISANSNNNSISTSPLNLRNPHHEIMNSPAGSILSVDMEMKPIRETNSNNNNNHLNFGIELGNPNKDGYPLMASFGNENHDGGGGSGSGYGSTTFSMEDIGRFHQQLVAPRFHGNGVSLTLGLPPSDNNNTNNNFPSQQVEFLSSHNMHLGGGGGGGGRIHHHHHEIEAATNDDEFCGMKNNATTPSSHSGTSYDHNNNNIDMQNRKRFASHQLLRDFVA
ncbi:BEL1-like homeodomain protein 1 isoform X1 [Arachis hypogaea]|uniref:BEL1-like homeodomain protein 1 isoform X1 n=1 Tax=Arachis hypogaea TaxID=3818 RepID=UPI000DEC1BAE|nr:BEL1-like homeodomain protein 1 isoform X1 [Arachis hypogaea]XP_025643158.1 BEL1-like homeodomain protein 1 isoform X1 [Arachis hypogaea]XP_025643160.1 BEL1-like homeodomain protein 1 isoform X1 [Arachis hypogaea]